MSNARHRLVHVADGSSGVSLRLSLSLRELGGSLVGLGGGCRGGGVDVSRVVTYHALRQSLRLDLVLEIRRGVGEGVGGWGRGLRGIGLRGRGGGDVAAAEGCLLVGEALGKLARGFNALGDGFHHLGSARVRRVGSQRGGSPASARGGRVGREFEGARGAGAAAHAGHRRGVASFDASLASIVVDAVDRRAETRGRVRRDSPGGATASTRRRSRDGRG